MSDLAEYGLDLRFALPPPEAVAGRPGGNAPIVIVRPRGGSPNFVGLIMQMRPDGDPPALPDWLGVKVAGGAGREEAS